jgi:hypothetical protein
MRIAVNLDDEFRVACAVVGDVRADDELAGEFRGADLPVTEVASEFRLCRGRLAPHPLRAIEK